MWFYVLVLADCLTAVVVKAGLKTGSEDVPSQFPVLVPQSPQYPNSCWSGPPVWQSVVLEQHCVDRANCRDNCTPPTHLQGSTSHWPEIRGAKLSFHQRGSPVSSGRHWQVLLTRQKFHHKVSPDAAEGKTGRVHRPLKGTVRPNKDIVRAVQLAVRRERREESGDISYCSQASRQQSL